MDSESLIRSLGYEPVRRLGEKVSSCIVYHVRRGDDDYLMKFSPGRINTFWDGDKHLEREYEVLCCVSGTEGVSQVVDYQPKNSVIIKDYIPGNSLKFGKKLTSKQVDGLLHTVSQIHQQGFARLEINPEHVVLSGGRPYLFDLGSAVRNDEVSSEDFDRYCKSDLENIAYFLI